MEHGAVKIWASPLRLAPLVKEHYFDFVGRSFPELLRRYQLSYPGASADAPRRYRDELEARIAIISARHGFGDDRSRAPEPSVVSQPPSDRQLALPL